MKKIKFVIDIIYHKNMFLILFCNWSLEFAGHLWGSNKDDKLCYQNTSHINHYHIFWNQYVSVFVNEFDFFVLVI